MVIDYKKVIGVLLLVVTLSGLATYYYSGLGVAFSIKDDIGVYKKLIDSRWRTVASEEVKLRFGNSYLNRDRRAMYTNITFDDSTNMTTHQVVVPYQIGPVVIHTWKFAGNVTEIEDVPFGSHEFVVINGTGLYVDYWIKDVYYDGPTFKLDGVQTSQEFENDVKVTWWPGYRLGWVYKSGSMYVRSEKLKSDEEIFQVKLFDPISDGLISYYNFTSDCDDDVNGNDGTIENQANFAPGKIGNGLHTNGGNDHCNVGDQANIRFQHMTIVFWARLNATISGSTYVVNKDEYRVRLSNFGTLRPGIFLRTSGGNAWFECSSSIGLNSQVFLAFEVNGTHANCYINGTLDDSDLLPGTVNQDTNDLKIGGDGSTGVSGWIDELGLFNKAIGIDNIQFLFNNGAGRQYPFPQTYFVNFTGGNDANNGTSISSPLKTQDAVTALSLNPSDIVLFATGEVWRGTLSITEDGSVDERITISSYGDGERPLFLGSVNASNSSYWSSCGTDLHCTPVNSLPKEVFDGLYDVDTDPLDPAHMNRETSIGSVNANWDFMYNSSNDRVILYHDGGSPETQTNRIELPQYDTTGAVVYITGDNVTFGDIDISYCRNNCQRHFQAHGHIFKNSNITGGWQQIVNTDQSVNVLLDNVKLKQSGYENIDTGAGGECFWVSLSSHVEIRNSELDVCHGVGINGFSSNFTYIHNNLCKNQLPSLPLDNLPCIYVDSCNNNLIKNNTVINATVCYGVNAEPAGRTSDNTTFRYNVADQCKTSFIADVNHAAQDLSNLVIDHNTFNRDNTVGSIVHDVLIQYVKGLTFTNNILSNRNNSFNAALLKWNVDVDNAYFDNNQYFSINGNYKYHPSTGFFVNFPAYVAGVPLNETNSITGDPQFVDRANHNLAPLIGNSACNLSSTDSFVGALPCANATDSCTCPGLNQNWEMDLEDACVISDDCDIGTGELSWINTGNWTCNATITAASQGPFPASDSHGYLDKDNCHGRIG